MRGVRVGRGSSPAYKLVLARLASRIIPFRSSLWPCSHTRRKRKASPSSRHKFEELATPLFAEVSCSQGRCTPLSVDLRRAEVDRHGVLQSARLQRRSQTDL